MWCEDASVVLVKVLCVSRNEKGRSDVYQVGKALPDNNEASEPPSPSIIDLIYIYMPHPISQLLATIQSIFLCTSRYIL